MNPASPFTGFPLVSDEVLTPGDGLRGVHSVYRYRIRGGPPQVFDQIAYTNDDASKLYMFYVRCSAECYEQRKQEIDDRGLLVHRPGDRMTAPADTTPRSPPPEGLTAAGRAAAPPEPRPTRKRMALWDRIRLLLLFADRLADHRLGGDGGQPAAAVRRRGAHPGSSSRSGCCGWPAPSCVRQLHFLDQRALGGLPPVLDPAGVRRHRAVRCAGGSPTGPGSGSPGCSSGRSSSCCSRWSPAQILETSPGAGAVRGAGAAVVGAAATILQLAFAFFFIAFQFIGAVLAALPRRRGHLLPRRHHHPVHRRLGPGPRASSGSRRTSSSWRTPTRSRPRAATCPSGLLLWGPPGTGKTLMAEAVAGETGKPYVFVDPGAFTNMFMGVGILKVKSLFRKLRKLALRYGGVIVFFDEADALGNRGRRWPRAARRRPRDGARRRSGRPAATASPTCRADTQWLLARTSAAEPRGRAARRTTGRNRFMMGGMAGGGGGGHGHAAGAAHRAVRAEEAARASSTGAAGGCSACGRSRRPSTGSWS